MNMPPLRPFIATVLLLGVVVGSSPALAQQPAASSSSDDAHLSRIRRQLSEPERESMFFGPVRADYRVRVEEEPADLGYKLGWIYDQTTATPGYVRPWYPIYHYELQSIMIPREFRAHLYPVGVPSGDVIKALKDVFGKRSREKEQRKARADVESEVKAIKAQQP